MINKHIILFLCLVTNVYAGWDYHYWTQEEVDQYIPYIQHKVGMVWWQKWNGEGNPDTSNLPSDFIKPVVISGKIGGPYGRPMAWNGQSIQIQWTDDLTKGWVNIGTTKVGPGCAPVYFNCRVNGVLGYRIKDSNTGFFRTSGTDSPIVHYIITADGVKIK